VPDSGVADTVVVQRAEVAVMFRRVTDDVAAIRRGWADLEGAIGSLRGRKFFGVFYQPAEEYRVCVQVRDGDNADALGLELGTLPGGRYLRARLHGEPPAVYDLIAPTVDRIAARIDEDPTRPGIEFYRGRDLIELFVPVA
jgi:DNA gyrase inhibitor GyrI